MTVQKVSKAGATSPVQHHNRPGLRQQPVPAPNKATVAEQIEHLANNYQRAVFCREHAEDSRLQWFAGRQREIAYVTARAAAGDPRFRNMTHSQLLMTGAWRWSQSSRGQYLSRLETKFTEWAHMYLSFAEVEALNDHGVPPR
jgi:hypothetical protein